MVFPVVMHGCESWTIKKAERWRIDIFELWCWRRLLRVPWTARRSNQSILKEISPGCSLVGLILKLQLQYFGHLMWRADSLEKTLMLVKIKGRRRREQQRMSWLDGITDSMDMVWVDSRSWWWTGRPGVLRIMGSQRVGHDWAIELNWTDLLYNTALRFINYNRFGIISQEVLVLETFLFLLLLCFKIESSAGTAVCPNPKWSPPQWLSGAPYHQWSLEFITKSTNPMVSIEGSASNPNLQWGWCLRMMD